MVTPVRYSQARGTALIPSPYVREEVEAALVQMMLPIPPFALAWGKGDPDPAAIAEAFLAAARRATEPQRKDGGEP